MNLRDLEYLVALADHRHFGRAARAVGVSQPTLSTQVKKLETDLGVPLVERGSRSVLLTPTGETIVAQARAVLQGVDDIEAAARAARDPHSGRVRIGLFPTLGPYLLPHVLSALREAMPGVEVLLTEDKTEALLELVHLGRLDAAVLALPLQTDGLHVEPLFREDLLLAVASGHALASGTGPVAVSDILEHDLLLLDDGHCLHGLNLDVCGLSGARPRDGFRATSLETLRHMVASGVGATLLPRMSVSPPVVNPEGLVLREIAEPVPARDIVMVWRASSLDTDRLTELARLFAAVPADLVTPMSPPSGGASESASGGASEGEPDPAR